MFSVIDGISPLEIGHADGQDQRHGHVNGGDGEELHENQLNGGEGQPVRFCEIENMNKKITAFATLQIDVISRNAIQQFEMQ